MAGPIVFMATTKLNPLSRQLELGMASGQGDNEFHYPIPIPVEKIHPHPHTQIQRVSKFCLIPIPTR